jgi:hypothetical protein
MQTRTTLLLALGIFLLGPVARANDIEGHWMLSLQDRDRTLVGLLEVEKDGDGWTAYLEGGPTTVETDGDNVVIVADSRDIRGFVFNRRMTGRIDGDSMSGTYVQEGASAQKEAPGPWRAVREPPQDEMASPPKPVDIAGIWTATQELDFRKYSMALTPAGEAWLESYLPYYDQPDVRCTSVGLPALTTYSFPFEIIESKDRFTMIYEYESIVRRIWMDGRQPSEYMPPSRMGHSNGHWEGSTLVIETKLLEKTVRDFRGELISENARIVERYDLGEDGNTLTMVVTVHDPDNYFRPPVRRRKWKRDNSAEIFPYKCDPDSFYIKMYEDGEMDMYIERTDKRF